MEDEEKIRRWGDTVLAVVISVMLAVVAVVVFTS
jgi:hypothetical protein